MWPAAASVCVRRPAFGVRADHLGAAGVQQDQLFAGIDQKGVDRRAHRAIGQLRVFEQLLDHFWWRIQQARVDFQKAIKNGGDFKVAHLHAVHAQHLGVGHRGLGHDGRNGGRYGGCAGGLKDLATLKGHGKSSAGVELVWSSYKFEGLSQSRVYPWRAAFKRKKRLWPLPDLRDALIFL